MMSKEVQLILELGSPIDDELGGPIDSRARGSN